jgi:plastocyanin
MLAVLACIVGLLAAAGTGSAARHSSSASVVNVTALANGLKFKTTVLHARAGKIKLIFHNLSTVTHNVRIESGESELGGTKTIAKGTTTALVTLKKGTYNFYCSVPGHEEAGMKGSLVVS